VNCRGFTQPARVAKFEFSRQSLLDFSMERERNGRYSGMLLWFGCSQGKYRGLLAQRTNLQELKPTSEIMEFGTHLTDLKALRIWIEEHDCRYVAMESTGID
jgi:hypothetical protein